MNYQETETKLSPLNLTQSHTLSSQENLLYSITTSNYVASRSFLIHFVDQ